MTNPPWPAMSMARAEAQLTAPGQRFEMETIDIRGVPTRVWKHAPRNLAVLTSAARGHGERTFLVHGDERISHEAHFRAVAHLAHALRAAGVGKGDRVALAMRNLPEWPAIFFAIASIGAIVVPLNAWWHARELVTAIADSGAKLLIVDAERHERLRPVIDEVRADRIFVARGNDLSGRSEPLERLLPAPTDWSGLPAIDLPDIAIDPDDPVAIFYTSGTTGAPKGAVGTHRNMATNILSTAYCMARAALRQGEVPPPAPVPRVNLLGIPFFHVTACSAALMGAVASGGALVLMRKWDAGEALRLIERERVQVTGGVPTLAWQLLDHPDRAAHDLSSLETIQYGGAPAAPELVRRIVADLGAVPAGGWGMTETMATVTLNIGEDYIARPESCGAPVPVADLRIMAPDGAHELPTGEVGELWARGPMVVAGYWNRPDATAETFVDGWVRTGDLARLDAEGFCTIVDRVKDVVIRGGENIHSIEVENVLCVHPAVAEAALVGVAHPSLGEEPAAVVHLRADGQADEAELRRWVAANLAPFKVPVLIRFAVEPLPRNAGGKLMKDKLRTMFA